MSCLGRWWIISVLGARLWNRAQKSPQNAGLWLARCLLGMEERSLLRVFVYVWACCPPLLFPRKASPSTSSYDSTEKWQLQSDEWSHPVCLTRGHRSLPLSEEIIVHWPNYLNHWQLRMKAFFPLSCPIWEAGGENFAGWGSSDSASQWWMTLGPIDLVSSNPGELIFSRCIKWVYRPPQVAEGQRTGGFPFIIPKIHRKLSVPSSRKEKEG